MANVPTRKIIFDCDPGVDDALALGLLLAHPEVELLGVTTVCGNAPVDICTRNACALLELAQRPEVPVVAGAQNFLTHSHDGGVPHIHGENGLGNIDLPTTKKPCEHIHAAQFIVDTILQHPNEVELIAVGPLTNLATALQINPAIASLTKAVHIMGGAFLCAGNVTEFAEANIHNDAQAAAAVFAAPWSGFVAPLDATVPTYFSQKHIEKLSTSSSNFAQTLARISDFYCKFYEHILGVYGCALHDPLAVGLALELVEPAKIISAKISVDTNGKTIGKTRLWCDGKELCSAHIDAAPHSAAPLEVSKQWKVLIEKQADFPDILAQDLCRLP